MDQGRLRARLNNWGCWLTYDADIGPEQSRCVSIESRFTPELGDVWEDDREPCKETPNVADAESMQKLIRQLDMLEQHCLALRYGGLPAVFKYRRISDHVMEKALINAEIMLCEMMRKSA